MARTIKKGRAGIARTETTLKIFNLFVKPILMEFILAPGATQDVLHRKLEMYFGKDDRDIWLVRAKVAFTIKGPRWLTDSTPEREHLQGFGERQVAKSDYLWVRTDALRPDLIDVEYKEQVFVCRTTDWAVLSEKCEYIL